MTCSYVSFITIICIAAWHLISGLRIMAVDINKPKLSHDTGCRWAPGQLLRVSIQGILGKLSHNSIPSIDEAAPIVELACVSEGRLTKKGTAWHGGWGGRSRSHQEQALLNFVDNRILF